MDIELTDGEPLVKGCVLCRMCNRWSLDVALAVATGWTAIGIKIVSPKEGEFHWGLCSVHSRVMPSPSVNQ